MLFAKSLSKLVQVFWEDCLYRPKLLLGPNKLIYLSISKSIFAVLSPLMHHSFLHSTITSGKLPQDIYFKAESFSKLTIICENNRSLKNN